MSADYARQLSYIFASYVMFFYKNASWCTKQTSSACYSCTPHTRNLHIKGVGFSISAVAVKQALERLDSSLSAMSSLELEVGVDSAMQN